MGAFIGVGVLSGILIGQYCNDARNFGIMLKFLFILCTACNVACAIIADIGFIHKGNASLAIMIALSAGSGAASLGFIGIGIEAAALYPAGPGYACWAVELV